MKRTILCALAILFMTTSCRFTRDLGPAPAPDASSTPAPTPPAARPATESTDPVLNLRYSDEPAARAEALSLDVYPATGADLPVVIFVHGGGWFRGDKSNVDAKPVGFNARGFVFVSVNYRLIPEVDVTRQMQDVARAVAWVKENIGQYGGDPSRMFLMGHSAGDVARAVAWAKENIGQYGGDPSRLFLMGHSAGGHLVSLLGTDESYLRAEGLSLADIRGVVSLDTQAYDIYKLMSNLPPASGEVYRETFGDDPEFWKAMSPQRHVKADKNIPPFAVVYTGGKESRATLSKEFFASLQEAGIPSVLLPAPEKTHGKLNREFGLPNDRISKLVFDWLDELLR